LPSSSPPEHRAGCVLITPAGGFVSPGWALALGAVGALPCYFVIVYRPRTRVDETLDVLAAHGVAGFTGILAIGFVAQASWNGCPTGSSTAIRANSPTRSSPISRGAAYAFCATYLLLRAIGFVTSQRGEERNEALGMDLIHHGEEAYASGEGAILVSP
jgi:ammonium transporter, Amt family